MRGFGRSWREEGIRRGNHNSGKAGRMCSRMGSGGDGREWGGRWEVRGGETRKRHYSDSAAAAVAGRLHAGITRSRQGEAAVSAAGTAAACDGAAAVAAVAAAEAAVGLLP